MLLLLVPSPVYAATVVDYSENFDGYTTSSFTGTGGWVSGTSYDAWSAASGDGVYATTDENGSGWGAAAHHPREWHDRFQRAPLWAYHRRLHRLVYESELLRGDDHSGVTRQRLQQSILEWSEVDLSARGPGFTPTEIERLSSRATAMCHQRAGM